MPFRHREDVLTGRDERSAGGQAARVQELHRAWQVLYSNFTRGESSCQTGLPVVEDKKRLDRVLRDVGECMQALASAVDKTSLLSSETHSDSTARY